MHHQPEFVQTIEGVLTIPTVENGGDDLEYASRFNYYYGDSRLCDFHDDECSHDDILWSIGDMGSPYFCTAHYFPQEQLGYEFIAESEV
jgi:hypothetical protein